MTSAAARPASPRADRAWRRIRIYISNPTPPTRWSQPVPIARIEAGARTLSTGVLRLEEAARPRRDTAAARSSGPPTVLVVGTLDTKGEELRFIRDIVAGSGLARAPRRRLDQRQALVLRRLRAGNCTQPRARRQRRVRFGSRRLGDRDGGGLRQLAAPSGRRRRRYLRRRVGRRLAGGARACARCRSACPSSSSRRSPRAMSRPMSDPPTSP